MHPSQLNIMLWTNVFTRHYHLDMINLHAKFRSKRCLVFLAEPKCTIRTDGRKDLSFFLPITIIIAMFSR